MIHLALKRVVPVRSREQEDPARRQGTYRPEHGSTPVGHVFQQGIENNNIELPDLGGKTCRVSDHSPEKLGIEINAGDLGAAQRPVNAPRTRSAPDIENGERLSLRKETLEAPELPVKFPGVTRRAHGDPVFIQV